MPLFLQTQLHFTALQAGLALSPLSVALMVAAPLSGGLSDRVGAKWLASGGLAVTAVAIAWMSLLTPATSALSLAPRVRASERSAWVNGRNSVGSTFTPVPPTRTRCRTI